MNSTGFFKLPKESKVHPCQILRISNSKRISGIVHRQATIKVEHNFIGNNSASTRHENIISKTFVLPMFAVLAGETSQEVVKKVTGPINQTYNAVKIEKFNENETVVYLPDMIIARVFKVVQTSTRKEFWALIEVHKNVTIPKVSLENEFSSSLHNTYRVKINDVVLLSEYLKLTSGVNKFRSWSLQLIDVGTAEIVFSMDTKQSKFVLPNPVVKYDTKSTSTSPKLNVKQLIAEADSKSKLVPRFSTALQRTKIDKLDHKENKNNFLRVNKGSQNNISVTTESRKVLGTAITLEVSVQGIQGYGNSCYADAVLFSMFAFTTAFDACLSNPRGASNSFEFTRNKEICKVLNSEFVLPLRGKQLVPTDAFLTLRNLLSSYNNGFKSRGMDAEEFLLILTERVWNLAGFYRFNADDDDTNFFYDIFASPSKSNETVKLSTILTQSFREQGVKLAGIPTPAFIIKLPVSNGKSAFTNILPDLWLRLENLLDSPKKSGNTNLLLRAVICLENRHYTCFVRSNPVDVSYWTYFDSKPAFPSTQVTPLYYLNSLLENPPSVLQNQNNSEHYSFLIKNAYMCIYEPTTRAL